MFEVGRHHITFLGSKTLLIVSEVACAILNISPCRAVRVHYVHERKSMDKMQWRVTRTTLIFMSIGTIRPLTQRQT